MKVQGYVHAQEIHKKDEGLTHGWPWGFVLAEVKAKTKLSTACPNVEDMS